MKIIDLTWTSHALQHTITCGRHKSETRIARDFARTFAFETESDANDFCNAVLSMHGSGWTWYVGTIEGTSVKITFDRIDEPNIRAINDRYGWPKPDWIGYLRKMDEVLQAHDVARLTHRGISVQDDQFVVGTPEEQETRALTQGGDTGPARISATGGDPRIFTATGNTTLADPARRIYTILPDGPQAVEALYHAFHAAISYNFTTVFEVKEWDETSGVTVVFIGQADDPLTQIPWGDLQEETIDAWKQQNNGVSVLDFAATPESITRAA